MRAIAAMVLSTLLYGFSDVAMKLAAASLPTGESVALRSLGAVALLATAAQLAGVLGQIRKALIPLMFWRSLGDGGNSLLFQAALARMSLADAMAILQLAPLSLTAAAALLLGAQVGWRRWTAVAVGFAGALLVIKPGTSAFNGWALLVIAAVLCGTLRDMTSRRFDPGLSPLVMILVSQAGVGVLALAGLAVETWRTPTASEIGQVAVGALFIASGHIAGLYAVRDSDLATVAPFRYSGIVWAIMLGFVVWGTLPDTVSLVGIAILVAAGLYTFYRERRLAAATSSPAVATAHGRPQTIQSATRHNPDR